MSHFIFPSAPRRRRLAWSGALFLAFDAALIGLAIAWITEGRHLGLAIALTGVAVLISALLAAVLARPARARIVDGLLQVEAGFQRLALPLADARLRQVDLRDWPDAAVPQAMRAPRWWQGGDAMGWQRDPEGQRWFAALPGRGPALQIDSVDGERLLLAPPDPEAFSALLCRAGAKSA